jgi:type III secretion protein J
MLSRFGRVLLATALLALAACSEELQHGLDEQDANDILVLLRENGIKASKRQDASGNEPKYVIIVAQQDYGQAAKLLREHSLPRSRSDGFSAFRKGKGMIPTQTEERAMMLEAYSGEVSMALQKIDGVLEARTIINMPEQNDLSQPDKRPMPSASVLVKYRSPIDGRPPLSDAQIRQFVATSIPEMKPEAVTVILSQSMGPAADVNADSQLKEVLIFRMTAASARDFKIAVGIAGLLILALAAFTAWTFLRGGQPAPAPARRARHPEA